MKIIVSTYRRYIPSAAQLRKTKESAVPGGVLEKFLQHYFDESAYYDWGDDPGFFSAQELLGDVRMASWGVCRPNVRRGLAIGDVVIFFCARPRLSLTRAWDYYYIGVGTIRDVVDRRAIWSKASLKPYRDFFNVLARVRQGTLTQAEVFHPHHPDWQRRLSNYILFDSASERTHFNVRRPLHVATYNGLIPEAWRSREDPLVEELERILFGSFGIARRLRTSANGYSHPPINLSARAIQLASSVDLSGLCPALVDVSRRAAVREGQID